MKILKAEEQGSGAFDGGKITEIKPVPFPHEVGGLDAMGPLFYWAWASAKGDGVIGMHPHKGFEIVSYALEGEIGHSDTLGTKSRVGKGGAQVMQTGSGVSHEEEMYGERTEFFQIWFEPDLKEAMRRAPTYAEFKDEDFPREERGDGVVVKRILGEGSPMTLVAAVAMVDVSVPAGARYDFDLEEGRFLAGMTVEGGGVVAQSEDARTVSKTDFVLTGEGGRVSLSAGDEGVRLVAIDAPQEVGHPLYSRR
ncbi:MAG: pirin family protein [Verrucomicrobiota bacterium]